MNSLQATPLMIVMGVALFFLGPLSGLLMDAIKVIMRLAFAGLLLQVLSFSVLENWSKSAVGFAHFAPVYVPVVALMFLVALSTANLLFLTGTKIEQWVKLVLYVIGGVFTAGSEAWINLEQGVGRMVTGGEDVFGAIAKMFHDVMPKN